VRLRWQCERCEQLYPTADECGKCERRHIHEDMKANPIHEVTLAHNPLEGDPSTRVLLAAADLMAQKALALPSSLLTPCGQSSINCRGCFKTGCPTPLTT
jgi:hypothetical protein